MSRPPIQDMKEFSKYKKRRMNQTCEQFGSLLDVSSESSSGNEDPGEIDDLMADSPIVPKDVDQEHDFNISIPHSPVEPGDIEWHSPGISESDLSDHESQTSFNRSNGENPGIRLDLEGEAVACQQQIDLPDFPDFEPPEPSDHGDDPDDPDSDSDNDWDDGEEEPHDAGNPINEEPLYPGGPITKHESFLAIMAFSIRHKLNGSCISDLLQLIDLHCLKPKTSLYEMRKHFENAPNPTQSQLYCSLCYTRCVEENICPNCGPTKVSYLIVYPVISQLQSMMSRIGFYESLNYKLARQKINLNNYEDIYDGRLYIDQIENGFLCQQSSVSFCIYTDGVNVFKSSKLCIWPVYLSINELPRSQRLLKENVIFAALWCGPVKPVANILLSPLRDELQQLNGGVPMMVPVIGRINVRAVILCGTADTPAREMMMCVNLHAGHYSCTKCIARGERVESVQVFPYEAQPELRTVESMRRDAALAVGLPHNHPEHHVNGVKGPSELANLIPNYVRGMAIDEMHNVQGVIKKLIALWFDPSFHMYDFNRSVFVGVADERLLKIKPPNFIKRKPRSIKEHRAYYKMSELRSLRMFYLIVILRGIISQAHLKHFMLFLIAIWHLSGRSISEENIQLAKRLLFEFVQHFAELYSLKFLTLNVHQLIHLPDMVRDLGPLWTTSCFGFEDLNGQVVNMVHGTRFTEKQITSSVRQNLSLPLLVSDLQESPTKRFCERMLTRGRKPNIKEVIDDRFGIVGNCARMQPIPPNVIGLLHGMNVDFTCVQQFSRLCKGNNIVYTTSGYDRGKKSISSCIKFLNNNSPDDLGIIENFIKVLNCNCNEGCQHEANIFVLVNVCQKVDVSFVSAYPYVEVPHIFKCEMLHEIIIIQPNDILGMNVLMEQDDGELYIAVPPVMSECNM